MSRTHRAMKRKISAHKPAPNWSPDEDRISRQEQEALEELSEEQEYLDHVSNENYDEYLSYEEYHDEQ